MSFVDRPWAIQLYCDEAQSLVIQKSSQVGMTEFAICEVLARAMEGFASIYVNPSQDFSDSFVRDRVNLSIDVNPIYRSWQSVISSKSMRLKHFNAGHGLRGVKFVGSNARSNFFGFPADTYLVDELDLCVQANLPFGEDRLLASSDPKIRKFGNPTIKGSGINRLYTESNQYRWMLRCSGCGDWQALDFFTHICRQIGEFEFELLDQRFRNGSDPGDDVRVFCAGCGAVLDRLAIGAWVARFPERAVHGYHIDRLFADTRSGLRPILHMWAALIEGLGSPSKLQNLYNSQLGIPFQASEIFISAELMASCALKGYLGTDFRAANVKTVIMGIDVGARLHYVLWAVDENRRRRLLKAGAAGWSDIDSLIKHFKVNCGVIDRDPEIEQVDKFLRRHPRFYACRYRRSESLDDMELNPAESMIMVDRTRSLDRSLAEFAKKMVILPENFRYIDGGEFVNQMEAPVRLLEEAKEGKVRYVWEEGDQPDHYRHADNYSVIALALLSQKPVEFL